MSKHQKQHLARPIPKHAYGFLPPNRTPWPDEPFAVPRGPIPPRKPQPLGNIRRAGEIVSRMLRERQESPIYVEHSSARTRLWVLDVYYFEVDRQLRRAMAGIVQADGALQEIPGFHLEWPLLHEKLKDFADRIFEWWPRQEQISLPYEDGIDKARRVAMAYVSKRTGSGGDALNSLVLHELALDPDVLRLTHEACGWRHHADSTEYQLVWRNLEAFRDVSLEKPHLTALLLVFLRGAADRLEGEPLAQVEAWFRRHGLSDSAWHLLVRTAPESWAPLWRRLAPEARLMGTLRFLKLVEKVGVDVPLESRVTSDWIRTIAAASEPALSFERDWDVLHPSVVRALYRGSAQFEARTDWVKWDELRAMLDWAARERIRLTPSQVRMGWTSLDTRWREAGGKPGPALGLESRPKRKGAFSSAIGSDNHYVVNKVAVPIVHDNGRLDFVYEDGYGNVTAGPSGFFEVNGKRPGVATMLKKNKLKSLDEIRYTVSYHNGACPGGVICCLLKSLRDIPVEYYGSGGVAASQLADHLEMEDGRNIT